MSLAFVMLANAAVLLLLTTLLWSISVRLRDVSIVFLQHELLGVTPDTGRGE